MAAHGFHVAKSKNEISLLLPMANRHGLIAGATGTGKTVSLKVLAESFSAAGVPVFMADVKGDLAGIAMSGTPSPKMDERCKTIGTPVPAFRAFPVMLWDVFGAKGHPVRTTISDMGPLLFSRLLDLNEVQTGVLNIVFKVADDNGLLLLDMKDLRAMLEYVGNNAGQFTTEYGTVSKQTIGAIQRPLLTLDGQGADKFFGEPALNITDFMKTDAAGTGYINILAADALIQSPSLYATFLLWLMSELFEHLPEAGDLDKPKMVFFFDEAHLLFDGAPKILLDKIEQVVRLIRSKGVGIYFVTQNPLDIPDDILGQLGNRIQHALRAFTPRDQKAVRAAAETFRANPGLDVAATITELGVGEALVSFLDEAGRPAPVERAFILPPQSRIGVITPEESDRILKSSPCTGIYDRTVDRESAYEVLQKRATAPVEQPAAQPVERQYLDPSYRGRPRRTVLETVAQSAASSIGRRVGTEIIRGILGSFLR
ncbi:MAG: DUF853 domain-containing protein [Spirochaetes bacterium]|nr:DUF853 domain-containing protein [Spirochaetota bacterium]